MRFSSPAPAAALAAALALTLPDTLDAQRSRERHTTRTDRTEAASSSNFARGYFAVGWRQVEVDALNAAMTASGYPAVSEDFITVGGGGQFIAGRILVGLEGFGLVGADASVSRGDFDATLGGGYGSLTLGFAAISTSRFRLYPHGSIGGGAMQLKIVDATRVSFDEVLTDPRRSSQMTQASLVTGAGLGMDYSVPFGSRSLLSIGVTGGYTFAPVTSRWYLNDDEFSSTSVTGGPDVGIEGPYARVSIGFGGRRDR